MASCREGLGAFLVGAFPFLEVASPFLVGAFHVGAFLVEAFLEESLTLSLERTLAAASFRVPVLLSQLRDPLNLPERMRVVPSGDLFPQPFQYQVLQDLFYQHPQVVEDLLQ